MKNRLTSSAIILIAISLSFTACDENGNPVTAEQLGEISGKVSFVGTWPATGDVQVSGWITWPPAGPPEAASDALQANNNIADFKLEGLQKSTYQVITVGWRDPNNPAGAKVLGIYWSQSDSLGVDANGSITVQPVATVIDDANLVYSNVNMKADLGIVK